MPAALAAESPAALLAAAAGALARPAVQPTTRAATSTSAREGNKTPEHHATLNGSWSVPLATVPEVSFVPLTGTAALRVGDPPRDGVVEFTDERRTVALPDPAALPVLTKAHARDDLRPASDC